MHLKKICYTCIRNLIILLKVNLEIVLIGRGYGSLEKGFFQFFQSEGELKVSTYKSSWFGCEKSSERMAVLRAFSVQSCCTNFAVVRVGLFWPHEKCS